MHSYLPKSLDAQQSCATKLITKQSFDEATGNAYQLQKLLELLTKTKFWYLSCKTPYNLQNKVGCVPKQSFGTQSKLYNEVGCVTKSYRQLQKLRFCIEVIQFALQIVRRFTPSFGKATECKNLVFAIGYTTLSLPKHSFSIAPCKDPV